MANDRKRAIDLGVVALSDLLTAAGYSSILAQLTAAQRQQLQRYLDAQVVDPAVQDAASAILQRGTKYYGNLVVTDPAAQREAENVMREYIPEQLLVDTTRIDLSKALDPKALTPTTDNPDEAAYLESVRKTLDRQGVWLRLAPKLVHDPQDPSRWIYDGKHFEVFLSLGPRGDAIPTKTGRIDREALQSTLDIGANFRARVDEGAVLRELGRQVQLLSNQIQVGMAQHIEMTKIRGDAAIGVVAISDVLGGADFPSLDIWEGLNALVLSAVKLRNAGRTYGAANMLMVAAIGVRNAANLLNTYIDKTTTGAARSVKVLKVARAAGEVAGVVLAIASGAAIVSGGGATSGAVVGDTAVDEAANKVLAKYLARNPDLEAELNSVRVVRGPR